MPSILDNLNALLAGSPITSDPKDVLYQTRTGAPSEQPTPRRKRSGPDSYRYYSDSGKYVYKRFDE